MKCPIINHPQISAYSYLFGMSNELMASVMEEWKAKNPFGVYPTNIGAALDDILEIVLTRGGNEIHNTVKWAVVDFYMKNVTYDMTTGKFYWNKNTYSSLEEVKSAISKYAKTNKKEFRQVLTKHFEKFRAVYENGLPDYSYYSQRIFTEFGIPSNIKVDSKIVKAYMSYGLSEEEATYIAQATYKLNKKAINILMPNGKPSILIEQFKAIPGMSLRDAFLFTAMTYSEIFNKSYRGPRDSNTNEPVLFFHGSNRTFDKFSLDAERRYAVHKVRAHWFTTNIVEAMLYGDKIYPAFLHGTPSNVIQSNATTPSQLVEEENMLIAEAIERNGKDTLILIKRPDKTLFRNDVSLQAAVIDDNNVKQLVPTAEAVLVENRWINSLGDDKEDLQDKARVLAQRYNMDNNGWISNYTPVANVMRDFRKALGHRYTVSYRQNKWGFRVYLDGKVMVPFNENLNRSTLFKQKESKSLSTTEKQQAIIDEKVTKIQNALGVEIIIDETISDAGQLIGEHINEKGEKVPVIKVNPKLLGSDTVLHEISHLIIDLIGGVNNELVLAAYEELERDNPELIQEIAEKYPELTTPENMDMFIKEVLATYLGREGVIKIINDSRKSAFKRFIEKILQTLRKVFGKDITATQKLLNTVLNADTEYYDIHKYDIKTIQRQKAEYGSLRLFQQELDKINDRLNIMIAKYSKVNEAKAQELVEEIKQLSEKMNATDTIIAASLYADEAIKQIEDILADIEDSKGNLSKEKLASYLVFLKAFDLVKSLHYRKTAYESESPELKEAFEELDEKIKTANNLYDDVIAKVRYHSNKVLIELLRPHFTRVKLKYRKQFEREFDTLNGGHEEAKKAYGSQYEQEKMKYIQSKFAEFEKYITAEETDALQGILQKSNTSLSFADLWLSGAAESDEQLLQLVTKLFDARDFNVKQQVMETTHELESLYREIMDETGMSMEEVNEQFLEKDPETGEFTGYFVGKYYSSFRKVKNEYFERAKKAQTPEKAKAILKELSEERKKYINPQWGALQNNKGALKRGYQKLMELNELREKLAGVKGTLKEKEYFFHAGVEVLKEYKTYRIPVIEKSTIEQVHENGFMGTYEKLKELFHLTERDQLELGQLDEETINMKKKAGEIRDTFTKKVILDESGMLKKKVPLYFRGRFDPKKHSTDLLTLMVMETHNIHNYKESISLEKSMRLLDELFRHREIEQNVNGIREVDAVNDKTRIVQGVDSNNYKKFLDILESRLYGIYSKDFGSIKTKNKTISVNKINKNLITWTGLVMLGFNAIAGAVNFLVSRTTNLMESVGGQFFGPKELMKAKKLLFKESGNILKDLNNSTPKSLPNLLAEKFDIFENPIFMSKEYHKNNLIKKFLSKDTFMIFTHSTEYGAQMELLLALMYKEKVYNEDTGEYIPMAEAYEVKDGKLVVKEGIEIPEELEFKIAEKHKALTIELHGNYKKSNKTLFQKTLIGSHVMLYRRWLYPGFQRRFRGGIKNIVADRDDINLFYNELLEAEREGMYISTARFVKTLVSDIKDFNLQVSTRWGELNDTEKANVKRTVVELGVALLAYVASSLLAAIGEETDDDDEKEWIFSAAYLLRRLDAELRFFASADALDILQTPAATSSMLKRISDTFSQLFSPTEEYETGAHAHENKLLRKIGKITPGYAQFNRNFRKAYEFLNN